MCISDPSYSPTTPARPSRRSTRATNRPSGRRMTGLHRGRGRPAPVQSSRRTVSWGDAAPPSASESATCAAASPQETILRLLWIGAGLPRPRCNVVIRRPDGRFVARVDLLDDHAGVVGEYDGSYHASSVRRSDDARRQAELESLGLVVVRATG